MGHLLFRLAFVFVIVAGTLAASVPVSAQTAGEVWTTTRETNSIAILKAFIEAFPDSIYAKLAAARIKELREKNGKGEGEKEKAPDPKSQKPATAEKPPSVGQTGKAVFATRRGLARAVQGELKRHRCYIGKVDGIWGRNSRKAVAAFARHASIEVENALSFELYEVLQKTAGPACPLSCGPRFVVKGEKCVAKTCPPGQRLTRKGKCVKPVAKRPCNEWRWRDKECGIFIKNNVCYVPKSLPPSAPCGCPQYPPPAFRHCKYRIIER